MNRFIAEDPIGFGGGANIYGYVGGNPVGAKDPTGEFIVPLAVGIGSFIVGYYVGDKIGGNVTDISDFFGNKKSADNLTDYSNQVTAACLNGSIQACGAMANFERQRRQCIGETLSFGTRLSNVPSGGPLQSQVGKSGLSVGKNR